MSKQPLKEFASQVAKGVSKVFAKHGSVLPFYHAITATGQTEVFPAPGRNKNESVALTRALLTMMGAVRVASVSEAWMLESPDGQALDIDRIGREGVSVQPGRIEVLVIYAEDVQEGFLLARVPISRKDGKAKLGELRFLSCDSSEGRMVGLLPKAGTRH